MIITFLEKGINKYLFKIDGLKNHILYEDISMDMEEGFKDLTKNTVGKYVSTGNPCFKIGFYILTKIAQVMIIGNK